MKVYFVVYQLVQRIPEGRVLTYGRISKLIDSRLSAQGVGWAMNALPEKTREDSVYNSGNVPWHRVVNSKGGMSTTKIDSIGQGRQRVLLEAEGIEFDENGLIDLDKYLWNGQSLE